MTEPASTCQQSTFERLPSNVWSLLVNALPRAEQGALRCVSVAVSIGLDEAVDAVEVKVPDLQALANLLGKLPGLKDLTISSATE